MRASTRLLFALLLPAVLLGGSGCTLLGYCAGGGTVQIGEELVLHRRERTAEMVP